MRIDKCLLFASTAIAVTVAAGQAHAQHAGAPQQVSTADGSMAAAEGGSGLQEIVITAQRTSENLQRAAIAVTAVSGDTVERAGITELANLATLVPAVQIARTSGPYNGITLSGVSSTVLNQFGDPAVAVNIDQIYQARSTGGIGQFFDIARVEVVKGPQGIFYGRNATGGAINIITNRPQMDEFRAFAGIDFGNYDQLILDGGVNVPLGETAAARRALQRRRRPGVFSDE